MDTPPHPSGRPRRPRVVVVGAGFGGIRVALALDDADCDVILVDRTNHHLFQPLLYQIATAALSPADIATPIRTVFRHQKNVQVILGEVTEVQPGRKRILMGNDAVAYDWLVLAAGATHAYFGNDQWEEHAPGLKTIDDALEIRRRVLMAFEEAELEADPEARRAKLTFVVVGAGPTGVEMAGALREIAAQTIPADFRRVDTTTARIILMEGADRVLPAMSPESSEEAWAALRRMGVEVRLNTFVTGIEEHLVKVGEGDDEEYVDAGNVIWAAGVEGSPVARSLEAELDSAGRVKVGPDCAVPGHPEIFVIGDLAAATSADSEEAVPGVAQGAMQMGEFVGGVIARELTTGIEPELRPEFSYRDKGSLATIGRARAVADIWGTSFHGFFAWLLWSLVHVLFLIGFRNKILVMVHWAWQWLVQARGARLITGRKLPRVKRPVDLGRLEDEGDALA
ncbi:MAG: NAD(P)/FAD-dependent oxidoreductase [Gemmatimonadales bacterium]|nr:MAG: NAD(P)/FAD-dependent oxidoreductase [Gemmatimonadales bacterium]